MAGGGLLQLVAYGAQDVYLTGNPQITFFKVIYRRHTNFALESIEQTFNGSADFGKRVTCTISRNGDLIHKVYLQTDVPAINGTVGALWVDYLGLALLKNLTVEIGGQQIDKHYGHWMYVWNELSQTSGHKTGYKAMVGEAVDETFANTLYVPLEFWFCRNVGLALPLIALQYHEIKINIEFSAWSEVIRGTLPSSAPSLGNTSLWVDYVFLDTEERRRFAQMSHEYLIEQLEFTGEETVTGTRNPLRLNFNHPVKELIWTLQRSDIEIAKQWFNYSTNATEGTYQLGLSTSNVYNPVDTAKLQLNGHDRFTERPGSYFSLVQPYQHHENVPVAQGINVYSFGLKPEEHQPSGTINMSRIDTAVLNVNLRTGYLTGSQTAKVRVYGTCYNVLRVMSGMGGLAYSN
jgi:hypothetical protein